MKDFADNAPEKQKYTKEFTDSALKFLMEVSENGELLALLNEEQRITLFKASGKISHPNINEIKKRNKAVRKAKEKSIDIHDRNIRATTGIRVARKSPVFVAPRQIESTDTKPKTSISPRNCYVCKALFTEIHFFYDSMCPECAEFNYKKRFQSADLQGRTALITGSRLKIGYQAALMLLRAGARVIATTRFPVDSAMRYAKESDFPQWKNNLAIYGLDLRHTPSVEIFANHILATESRLDFLINNAAQTVRRPPGFYAHLLENETKPFESLPDEVKSILSPYKTCLRRLDRASSDGLSSDSGIPIAWNGKIIGIGLKSSALLSQIPYTHDYNLSVEEIFPQGKLDADLQQVDLRTTNSWRLKLGEIQTAEMIEVQLVNAIAPFVLCNHLIPLMKKDNTGDKHVVNVSAMEGKFHRFMKADRHPHTNMAKAALNMMTHTSAGDLIKSGIHTNAVDTGWVTDEDPVQLSKHKEEVHDFQPPLDIVDGAARVLDPIFDGILTGNHWNGKFLKDYKPIDW
ncbi:MAG: SDR family oxidoreductase [Leptospiraceae bacterium]|nr:SDR family oxidoreductase [Leptospiraceae bacterium]